MKDLFDLQDQEIWKPIKGYEGLYEISSLGSVCGLKYGNKMSILALHRNRHGYICISLSKNGKRISFRVHRIVAEAFISNPENKSQVNHKNGIKNDNRVCNLEWVTPRENTIDAHKNGLCNPCKGEKQGSAKLTEPIVLEIRAKHIPLVYGTPQLAKEYGVYHNAIWMIIKRKTWKHI